MHRLLFGAKLAALGLLLVIPLTALQPLPNQVYWLDNLDDALRLAQQSNRHLLVDVYAPWCGWCKIMHTRTYSNPKLVGYLNQKFVAVRLNGESKDTLQFQRAKYAYNPERRANDLAYLLLDGRMTYPTTVIMTAKAEILSPIRGYMDVPTMDKVLHFYGESAYTLFTWREFEKQYKPAE